MNLTQSDVIYGTVLNNSKNIAYNIVTGCVYSVMPAIILKVISFVFPFDS